MCVELNTLKWYIFICHPMIPVQQQSHSGHASCRNIYDDLFQTMQTAAEAYLCYNIPVQKQQ